MLMCVILLPCVTFTLLYEKGFCPVACFHTLYHPSRGFSKIFSKTDRMENTNSGDLPEEVMWEILLRLPVKSLLQFKCVCKHWCTLIGSPSFVHQHFGHESNQERLLIRNYRLNEERYAFTLYVDEMLSGYDEPDHLQMPDTVADLMGPFNGVFCVVTESGNMALLNPAMRQFKPLPLQNAQPPLSVFEYVLLFGLDPLSGDYKLVWSHRFWHEKLKVYPPLVSIYNSGNDSWRHFEDVDLFNSMNCAHRSACDTCLNGVYYCLMESNDAGVAIFAFDMSSEKFQEIQVPDCIKSEERERDLALYGDSIALLSYDDLDKIDRCIDVWIMKKEGCWTKSLTIGPSQDITWPLCFWRNNELLLEIETPALALYNVSTQKLRPIQTRQKWSFSFVNWVFSYKESLVSIKRERDNCKLWDTSSDFIKDFFKNSSSNR